MPSHTSIEPFTTSHGELVIGNVPLTLLAERVGRTPFYAYDRAIIAQRVASLREALPDRIILHYAMKANPMPAVVDYMATLVDGIDVASAGELLTALDSGMPAEEISFAGPGKSDTELRQAVASGILINVESPRELDVIHRHSDALGIAARVAVRVNPDFELKSSGMKMGGGPKQFGIDAEVVPDVLRSIGARGLRFEGFHLFAGSQNLRASAICEAQHKSFELALRLSQDAPAPVRVLNLGGGFGIPYFPGDAPLDLKPIGANLQEILLRAETALPGARVVIELGRYLVGEAGIYVARVVDIKESRGQVFLVTDGGLHHHLAASGNFGQVLRKNYPVVIGNKIDFPASAPSIVVGPLCTPLDLLAEKIPLPKAEPGDLIVVFQSGAYGLTASPLRFLNHPSPLEVIV